LKELISSDFVDLILKFHEPAIDFSQSKMSIKESNAVVSVDFKQLEFIQNILAGSSNPK
jgi:hypothetical protein